MVEPSVCQKKLSDLESEITACRACPRLVGWREQVAVEKRAAYRNETYWGRPIAGFGDPAARIVVLGLAPAAHGANRTGRMFTGDRSGDWLFRAMYRAGLASQPESISLDDGLVLTDAWVTSAVKCAPPGNTPTTDERDMCRAFVAKELVALTKMRVVLCLGAFAYEAACSFFGVQRRPRFGHGVEVPINGGPTLICSYHVSQQNTFTGRLTEPMLDAVFVRAVSLCQAKTDVRARS